VESKKEWGDEWMERAGWKNRVRFLWLGWRFFLERVREIGVRCQKCQSMADDEVGVGEGSGKEEREKSKEGDAWSSSKRGYDKAEEESSD